MKAKDQFQTESTEFYQMKVPSLGTEAKKIMTQPLLTNKVNRRKSYR